LETVAVIENVPVPSPIERQVLPELEKVEISNKAGVAAQTKIEEDPQEKFLCESCQ